MILLRNNGGAEIILCMFFNESYEYSVVLKLKEKSA